VVLEWLSLAPSEPIQSISEKFLFVVVVVVRLFFWILHPSREWETYKPCLSLLPAGVHTHL